MDEELSYPAGAAALTGRAGPTVTLLATKPGVPIPVSKKAQRTGSRPGRPQPEPKPAWPTDRHSGEGSASALEMLQKLESRRRLPPQPADARDPDGDPSPES
jgi:hypothetical protein